MKLDINALRYLSQEEFRVLTAVEMGQKNHKIVPVDLITSIAGLKHGGTHGHLGVLLRYKLLHHDRTKYDGYRLTYMGYDFLAIRTLLARGRINAVGRRIGVGKESDVFEVRNEEGEVMALKLHRLGRTSFRAVKNKRDYLKDRSSASFSWLYLSRLAALKEFAFMAALEQRGMPVPRAVDHNRHAVLMSVVDAYPLTQVRELGNPGVVYSRLMNFITSLARLGLIHCDFNEFNVLVNDEDEVTIIDFPQMVSVAHPNAQELFDRDVEGIERFFTRKLGYAPQQDHSLQQLRPVFSVIMAEEHSRKEGLDVELAASGFKDHHQEALGRWQQEATAAQSDFNDFLNSGSVADSHVDDNSSSSSSSSHVDDNSSSNSSHVDDNSSSSSCHNSDSAANICQAGGQGKELADVEQIRSSRLAQAVVATAAQLVGADPARPSFAGRTRFSQPEEDGSGSCSSSSELVGHSGPDFVNMAPSSRRRLQSSGAGSVAGTSCSTRRPAVQSSPEDVQHRVTSARQGFVRRNVMAQASRNAQKRVSLSRRGALDASMKMG